MVRQYGWPKKSKLNYEEKSKIRRGLQPYWYCHYEQKGTKIPMIKITQEEYFQLKDKIDSLHVKICSQRKRGAKSKTYWCEETKAATSLLTQIRKAVDGH